MGNLKKKGSMCLSQEKPGPHVPTLESRVRWAERDYVGTLVFCALRVNISLVRNVFVNSLKKIFFCLCRLIFAIKSDMIYVNCVLIRSSLSYSRCTVEEQE